MTIGWVYTEQGDFFQAEKYLCSAREAHLALEDQPGLAMCLAAQATIHRVLGDPTAARFWCERALEIARGSSDDQVTAICLTTMALAWLEEGENLQAIDSLIEARSLAREVGAADTEHLACLALARILLCADRLGEVPGLLNRLIERAETMHLSADIPAVLFLQALFRCRLGNRTEAVRLIDEALARSEEASSAETRWELRHFRLFLADEAGDEKTSERLRRELQTWTQSCATTVPEDEKRKAFLRRIETQKERLEEFLAKPPIQRPDDEPATTFLADLPAADLMESPEGEQKLDDGDTVREAQPANLLRVICASDHERSTLKSVLNLLVDRAVHATYSARGGLFLQPTAFEQLHVESSGHEVSLSPLLPIALRNLERESLHDAHDMSHSVLRAAVQRGDDITSDDLIQDPRWEEALTERIRRIPAILAIPVIDSDPTAQGLRARDAGSASHSASSKLYGVIYLERDVQNHPYSQDDRRIIRTLAREMARVFTSLASDDETWNRIRDLQNVIDRLDTETLPPSERIEELEWGVLLGDVKIVGVSRAMAEVFERTKRLGATRTPVLITGETGTGKELIARALHQTSPWHESPFVAVDCGALTESLAEAELFGHARGAFSGAERERQGLLRSAGDGTFFLDEIGNLAPNLQLKLLRALETGEVRPVGSDHVHPVRCRLVAASNSDLSRQMRRAAFPHRPVCPTRPRRALAVPRGLACPSEA
jgi:tetratricopeptide (TPR) repeat protein